MKNLTEIKREYEDKFIKYVEASISFSQIQKKPIPLNIHAEIEWTKEFFSFQLTTFLSDIIEKLEHDRYKIDYRLGYNSAPWQDGYIKGLDTAIDYIKKIIK